MGTSKHQVAEMLDNKCKFDNFVTVKLFGVEISGILFYVVMGVTSQNVTSFVFPIFRDRFQTWIES